MSRELGDGALYIFYVGPSCLTPPRYQRGLRAKNGAIRILKRAGKDKKNRERNLGASENSRNIRRME